jgi:hypothetical protein
MEDMMAAAATQHTIMEAVDTAVLSADAGIALL